MRSQLLTTCLAFLIFLIPTIKLGYGMEGNKKMSSEQLLKLAMNLKPSASSEQKEPGRTEVIGNIGKLNTTGPKFVDPLRPGGAKGGGGLGGPTNNAMELLTNKLKQKSSGKMSSAQLEALAGGGGRKSGGVSSSQLDQILKSGSTGMARPSGKKMSSSQLEELARGGGSGGGGCAGGGCGGARKMSSSQLDALTSQLDSSIGKAAPMQHTPKTNYRIPGTITRKMNELEILDMPLSYTFEDIFTLLFAIGRFFHKIGMTKQPDEEFTKDDIEGMFVGNNRRIVADILKNGQFEFKQFDPSTGQHRSIMRKIDRGMLKTIVEIMLDVEENINGEKQTNLRSVMTSWALSTFLVNVLHKMGAEVKDRLEKAGVDISMYFRRTFDLVREIKRLAKNEERTQIMTAENAVTQRLATKGIIVLKDNM